MAQPKEKNKPSINDIARSAGAGKINQIYYHPKAPHNQPFNSSLRKSK